MRGQYEDAVIDCKPLAAALAHMDADRWCAPPFDHSAGTTRNGLPRQDELEGGFGQTDGQLEKFQSGQTGTNVEKIHSHIIRTERYFGALRRLSSQIAS